MLRRDAEITELVGEDGDFGGLMAVGSDPTWKQLAPDAFRRMLRQAVYGVLGPYRPLE